jgi:hypothetical protein
MNLDAFMDDFGRDLHRAAAPKKAPRRRILIAAGTVTGLAAVGVIALPRGDGVDAIAAARAALAPENDIVHMTIKMKPSGKGKLRVYVPTTEQWYSASLGRWRTKTQLIVGANAAKGQSYEQIYGGDRMRLYDARRDVVHVYDGVKLPKNAQVGVAGGDPATDLRKQLDAGDIRDAGVVTRDGRQVRALVREDKRLKGRFQQKFVYYMDAKTFAPVGGRMYFSVKGRKPFISEFVISGYERIPLTAESRRLLHFDTTDQTKYVWRKVKTR